MIESVFNVQPLAARETSNDVGNLLSAINFNHTPQAAPALPTPQPVTPQKICLSSINSGGGLASPHAGDPDGSFQRLQQAALERGWRVYP